MINQRYDLARSGRGLCSIEAIKVQTLYAEVALESNIHQLADKLFTYAIPGHLQDEVFVGTQVLVPFRHHNLMSGYVVALKEEKVQGKTDFSIKPILEVLEAKP